MLVLCLAVFAPLLLAGGNCQVNDDCDLVRVGLEPVLAPCRTSVETCVIEASFATFTDVFCRSEARNQFNNFLDCEGRPFTDQIFGAICGGPSCAGPDQTFSQCEPGEGERCYDDPVVGRNSGTAAFEACLCSNNSQSSTNPSALQSALKSWSNWWMMSAAASTLECMRSTSAPVGTHLTRDLISKLM